MRRVLYTFATVPGRREEGLGLLVEGRTNFPPHTVTRMQALQPKRAAARAAARTAAPTSTGDSLFEGPGLSGSAPPSTVDHVFEVLAKCGLPGCVLLPTTVVELRGEFNEWRVGELRCASGCAGRRRLSHHSGRPQVWLCLTIPTKAFGL